MLDYVYGHDQAMASFVAQLIPHARRGFGPNVVAFGVVDGTELIAGVVYHNWEPEAAIIEISAAALPGRYWLTRETIKRMYQYPFLYLNCQMVVQRVPADDERQLWMLARYDFAFTSLPRLFGRDRDGVVCCLTREAWEANKFNKRLRHHVGAVPSLSEAA